MAARGTQIVRRTCGRTRAAGEARDPPPFFLRDHLLKVDDIHCRGGQRGIMYRRTATGERTAELGEGFTQEALPPPVPTPNEIFPSPCIVLSE